MSKYTEDDLREELKTKEYEYEGLTSKELAKVYKTDDVLVVNFLG